MQATIASFDQDTQCGRVLLDNGQELTFDAMAFAESGMRSARLGQRVTVTVGEADAGQVDLHEPARISRIRLVTFD